MVRFNRSLIALVLLLAGCSGMTQRPVPIAQNREVDSFAKAAAWPNAEASTVISAAQQYAAARREPEGYEYFHKLAQEQPGRPILVSVEGMLQARMAGDVPLLRRVAWVEDAIRKLDRGAEAEPVAGRLVRGLVFAALPARFDKARQAVSDLEASLAARDSYPIDLDRAILVGLATAHRTLGETALADEMLRKAGQSSLDAPPVAGNFSVGPEPGFRFTNPHLVREGEGVYVAEGYDFGNIAFLVNEAGVVVIDAGTTQASAGRAMKALRQVTQAPVRYVIVTHSHWDHIGGLAAVREPGTVVIARANLGEELARMRSSQQVFPWFFGTQPVGLEVPDPRLVSGEQVLRHGKLELHLIPVSGGETADALFVHLPQQGLLFAGDAFMPYVGPPFLSEGSPEGYLEALAKVRSLAPRRVIHGHPPLTRFFTAEAIPGLETALRSLYEHAVPEMKRSRPLTEILHDDYLPQSLVDSPKSVLPYLVVRDHFLQRLYLQNAGYWQADGEGIEHFTRAEQAAVLDRFGGGGEGPFTRVVEDLISRGDAPLALRVADLGLLKYPKSETLQRDRKQALSMMIERFGPVDPFRFIVYSQWTGASLGEVSAGATGVAEQP